MECITGIQNLVSESIHSGDKKIDSELVRMCHCTVGLITINTLNMGTPVLTVACNKFPCIRTGAFPNTWSNELTEEIFSFRDGFYWYESRKKADIFALVILHK